MRNLPTTCPGCASHLAVARLVCLKCGTAVEGSFGLPVLAALSAEDQQFIADFVKSSGSLKEMARLLGVSYPTVRNRLDEIIARVRAAEGEET